jgi:hypothetical protein
MTQTNDSTSQPPQASLGKRMLIGAWIGLLLISLFLLTAGEPDPEWGTLWRVRPLIVVTFAGAMGGLCNYLIMRFHNQFGVNRIIAMMLSGIVFIVGLWLGTVLGLDGTYWN